MKMKIKRIIPRMCESILWAISPKLCLTVHYLKKRGRLPNFKNPKDLSEIVLSKMLSGEICKIAPYVDKVEVRKFIEEWGFGEYLPKLYGVWNSADEIDFDSLPQSFALKTNHGCGSHYICPDKGKLDKDAARERIRKALTTRFGKVEKQYNCITPKCYAEEYINDVRGGGQPLDYKFHCCDGEIRCILICSERDTGTRLATYDTNWNRLNYVRDFEASKKDFSKPENFEKMKEIATAIAKKFEYVRVDLYSLPGGKIYIGELTFTPEGGIMSYFTNEAVSALGHKK